MSSLPKRSIQSGICLKKLQGGIHEQVNCFFFKKIRLRQVLTVFLAGVLLVISTACNSANAQGANPINPPVQAGGANNPYKGGGDKYTDLKMSTDPKVSKNRC